MALVTAEEFVFYVLTNDATVAAIIGTEVYSEFVKTGIPKPYVVYSRFRNEHSHHMGGASGLSWPVMYVHSYSPTIIELTSLMDAIRLSLDGFPKGDVTIGGNTINIRHCFLDDEQVGFVPPKSGKGKGIRVGRQDFNIAHNEVVPTFA